MSRKIIFILIFLAISIFLIFQLFAPTHTTKEKIPTPLLKFHNVYVVYVYSQYPPSAHIIGEGLDGKTFRLPEEFNEMIIRENITIDTEKKALDVAATYVNSSIAFGRIIILKNSSDIPKRNVSEYLSIIKLPYSIQKNDKFFVRFYTWREVGGYVDEWSFNVSIDGKVSVERDEIASKIGAFGMLQ